MTRRQGMSVRRAEDDGRVVNTVMAILIAVFFVTAAVLVAYVLITLWPSGGNVPKRGHTYHVLGTSWTLTPDQTLLVLVIFAGTLGGLSRCLFSLTKYMG